MRIAISSTTGIDRAGIIDRFIKEWPLYTKNEAWKSIIRDSKSEDALELNKKILTGMRDETRKYGKDDNVIFNRCTFDMMGYILWGHTESPELYTEEYVEECKDIFRESTKFIDIIYYIPLSRVSNNLDQTKKVKRIDDCLKFIERQYMTEKVSSFFIHDDRPALIELVGDIESQIGLMKLYLNDSGGIDEKDTDILPPEVMELLGKPEDIDVNQQINDLLKTK